MKKLFVFLMILILCSCKKDNTDLINQKIYQIQNSEFQIFEGITIESRYKKDSIFKAPSLFKELEGEKYFLPNYSYYGCNDSNYKECLERITNHKFDIIAFSKKNNIEDENMSYDYVKEYTNNIFDHYEKINVPYILSKESIGNCIIFYIGEHNFLAYVPDRKEILNTFWLALFNEDNLVSKNWYSGVM